MMTTIQTVEARSRRIRFACVGAAFTPLLVGVIRGVMVIGQIFIPPPAPKLSEIPVKSALSNAGPVTWIPLSAQGTEATEVLLAASAPGARARLVGPKHEPMPSNSGVFFLPSATFEELAQERVPCDTLVLPSFIDFSDPAHDARVKPLTDVCKTTLAVGQGGSMLASRLGLLRGFEGAGAPEATTYFYGAEALMKRHSNFKWNFNLSLSCAQETCLSDGALGTARSPKHAAAPVPVPEIAAGDIAGLFIATALTFSPPHIAVLVYDGASAFELGTILGVLTRTFGAHVETVSVGKQVATLDNGIQVVAFHELDQVDAPEILIIPRGNSNPVKAELESYAKLHPVSIRDFQNDRPPLDKILDVLYDPALNLSDRLPLAAKLGRFVLPSGRPLESRAPFHRALFAGSLALLGLGAGLLFEKLTRKRT